MDTPQWKWPIVWRYDRLAFVFLSCLLPFFTLILEIFCEMIDVKYDVHDFFVLTCEKLLQLVQRNQGAALHKNLNIELNCTVET